MGINISKRINHKFKHNCDEKLETPFNVQHKFAIGTEM